MSENRPLDFESLEALIRPPVFGEITYSKDDGQIYSLVIRQFADGYQIFQSRSTDLERFKFLLLRDGSYVTNTETEESKLKVISVLEDLTSLIDARRK